MFKKRVWSLLVMIMLLVIIYLLLPVPNVYSHWTFGVFDFGTIYMLTLIRNWIVLPMISFVAIFFIMELMYEAGLHHYIKKQKTRKIVCSILAGAMILASIYFSVGSILFLAPPPPMNMVIWREIYVESRYWPCVWCAFSSIITFLAVSF